jgi:cytochrome c oxidase assembly protein subunit 15
MVASGFEADSTAVSPYRLVAHLVLALTLYSAILWTALGLYRGPEASPTTKGLRRISFVMVALVALTIVAGGFVAGTKAGLTYNSFPLMDGRLVPEGYAMLHPFLRNLVENIPAVQFDHRLLATMTATLGLAIAFYVLRAGVAGAARSAAVALGLAVTVQYALGVATLLRAVPVDLATSHQAVAVLVLTASLILRHTQRRAAAP